MAPAWAGPFELALLNEDIDMGLAIRKNPDTGEDEFYDDGEGNGPTTGAAYTPEVQSTSANDGDAGEWSAREWITNSFQTNGLADTALGEQFAASYDTGGAAAARRLSSTNLDGMAQDPKPEKNVFERITGRVSDGISQAFDKDPLKFLEAGLGGVAGLYKTKQARDAAAALAQGRLEEINANAAADKAKQDRYSASISAAKRTPVGNKPLKRMDGSNVWDANGRMKG